MADVTPIVGFLRAAARAIEVGDVDEQSAEQAVLRRGYSLHHALLESANEGGGLAVTTALAHLLRLGNKPTEPIAPRADAIAAEMFAALEAGDADGLAALVRDAAERTAMLEWAAP